MATRKQYSLEGRIAVDVRELAGMLALGTASADKLGKEAGAVVRIGKRKLFRVDKINEYLERLSEEKKEA